MEMLLNESPNHPGLLLTACRGFVLYSYGYVDYEAQLVEEEDLDKSKVMKIRARKLYLRALRYGLHGLEQSYPGFENLLFLEPEKATAQIIRKNMNRDLPFLIWNAAALGLAISASRDDAALLARLPEVEAMMDKGLELDETWEDGLIHMFKVQLASAKVGGVDQELIRKHYERALELSQGRSAGVYVAYVEAVSIPNQNISEFRSLLALALAVDPDQYPEGRLLNLMAQRRARWLLDHVDGLFLDVDSISELKGGRR
jgi:predicted anti-sigma-YlaC factor YlaD